MSHHAAINERSIGQGTLDVSETDDFYIVKGVRVLNEVSKNGGTYSRKARESAARLCNRLPLSIEHTDEKSGRKYLDRVGQLREGRMSPDGQTMADAWINRGSRYAQQIKIDAKHCPENICLSIELPPSGWIGEDKRHVGGGYIVEDIVSMDDCAIVASGGTTKNLYEGHRPEPTPDEDDMTATPSPAVSTQSVSEAIRSQLAEAEDKRRVQEQIDRLTRERDDAKAVASKLQEQVAAFQASEQRRTKAVAIVEKAKTLGAGEISTAYAETLAKLDDVEVEATLKERAELLKRAGGGGQSSSEPAPNFHAPSVGGTSDSQTPSPFSWLK